MVIVRRLLGIQGYPSYYRGPFLRRGRWWLICCPHDLVLFYAAVGWLIRAAMVPVVLRRQLAPGASLAWLGIVFLHPYIGLTLYMLVGESRLGPRWAQRHREIISNFRDPARHPDRKPHETQPDASAPYQPMIIQAEKISGLPVLCGNAVEFFTDTDRLTDALVAEIAAARKEVHLLYYIFANDAIAERVAAATIEASRRGVKCRVLADAIASRKFFHADGLAPELIAGGVEVAAALPVAPIRRRFARLDLRNHRKLAIIDGQTAFRGQPQSHQRRLRRPPGKPLVRLHAPLAGPHRRGARDRVRRRLGIRDRQADRNHFTGRAAGRSGWRCRR